MFQLLRDRPLVIALALLAVACTATPVSTSSPVLPSGLETAPPLAPATVLEATPAPSPTPAHSPTLSAGPTPESFLSLFVSNELDRDVVILVDGTEVLQVGAGDEAKNVSVPISSAGAGVVEARTVEGAPFESFDAFGPADFFGQRGFEQWLDCGELSVWVGEDIFVEITPPRPPLPPCP